MSGFGKLLILGDSYSTFKGYISPECEHWYDENPRGANGVNRVEQTWWHQLISQTDTEMLLNCSWSGTTICHTGYTGDCSYKSFVGRLERLIEEDYFAQHTADTVIVFGGTNDSWADSPIGELKYADWQREDLFSVLPACSTAYSRCSRRRVSLSSSIRSSSPSLPMASSLRAPITARSAW